MLFVVADLGITRQADYLQELRLPSLHQGRPAFSDPPNARRLGVGFKPASGAERGPVDPDIDEVAINPLNDPPRLLLTVIVDKDSITGLQRPGRFRVLL